MRFEWDDDISYYVCTLYDDNNKRIDDIRFFDYSSKERVLFDEKNHFPRPYAYEVYGCGLAGRFDCDKHFLRHYGWRGKKEHSVEDIKRWCENYLAKGYIIDYDTEFKKLNERKRISDWFVENGYGVPEEEIER